MVTEILKNLWQVGGGDRTGAGDAAAYLVRFGDQAALMANIAACLPEEVPIEHLFLTHIRSFMM